MGVERRTAPNELLGLLAGHSYRKPGTHLLPILYQCPFACQFRIRLTDEVPLELGLMIRNLLPSGAISQLKGPVRMPVSTISVSNRARGVPAWKVGRVVTSTAIIFQSGET